jgi:hypothetical protein
MPVNPRDFRRDEGLRLRPLREGEPSGHCGLCGSAGEVIWAIPLLATACTTCRRCAPKFLLDMLSHYRRQN